jgi:anthranilate/para-aminobenzoate synthase component I
MRITSFDEFKELAQRGTFVPVCKEIVADLLTPVSAFLKIAEHSDYAFLLESVEGGDVEAAVAAVSNHIREAGQLLMRKLEARGEAMGHSPAAGANGATNEIERPSLRRPSAGGERTHRT